MRHDAHLEVVLTLAPAPTLAPALTLTPTLTPTLTLTLRWYYAPNTFKVLKQNQLRRAGRPMPSHPAMAGSKWASVINPDWLTVGPVFYSAARYSGDIGEI